MLEQPTLHISSSGHENLVGSILVCGRGWQYGDAESGTVMCLNREIGRCICRVDHFSISVKEAAFKLNISPRDGTLVGYDSCNVNLVFFAGRLFIPFNPIQPGFHQLKRPQILIIIWRRIYEPGKKGRDRKCHPEEEDEHNADDYDWMAERTERQPLSAPWTEFGWGRNHLGTKGTTFLVLSVHVCFS